MSGSNAKATVTGETGSNLPVLAPKGSGGSLGFAEGVRSAQLVEHVLPLLMGFASDMKADGGLFTGLLRDESGLTSYQSVLACDAGWSAEYEARLELEQNPWLRHATQDTEPVRAEHIRELNSLEYEFMQAAASAGFRSAIAVPAPTCHGASRVGVLVLGRQHLDVAHGVDWEHLCVASRAFAMELHAWMVRATRANLVASAGIDTDDIALLRHEAAGHSSKTIASILQTQPQTIDCRFQRLSARLGAPNRRVAARLARLHGLIY